MFSGMNYVYEVYKEQSFSKVTESLYVSQPAPSSMIKKIETKIDMPLFDRSTIPTQLTECGKKYIKIAEKIMGLEDELAYYVGNLQELKVGRLPVDGTYLLSSSIFPPIIDRLRRAYPHIRLNLSEGHTPLPEQKLSVGELDITTDNYLLDAGVYEKERSMEEYLLLAVPSPFDNNWQTVRYQFKASDIKRCLHQNDTSPATSLKKFKDEPFVMLRSHNDTRERVDTILSRAGTQLNYTLKLNQLLTTYHLIEYGMGVSFVSDTVVRCLSENPNIMHYKIDNPEAVRDVYLYHKKNRYLTRNIIEFIKMAIPGIKKSSKKYVQAYAYKRYKCCFCSKNKHIRGQEKRLDGQKPLKRKTRQGEKKNVSATGL